MSASIRVYTTASSATAPAECRGHVLASGSYGGEYNAYHAGKHGIRGVILNDAGVGKERAGIRGLEYLDCVGLAAATADVMSCHIGDGAHMLRHGIISFVNRCAARLGCAPGDTVRACAERLKKAPIVAGPMPAVSGGGRWLVREEPGEPRIVCVDAAPMLEPGDAGSIAVTGSHAALLGGKPDGLIAPAVRAVFFSDAGVGMDQAGIARLPLLDERGIPAGTASAASAAIGDSRSIHAGGVLSFVNEAAAALGGAPGMRVRDFIELLIARWRAAP
ncbi:MAG: hypothetical protein ACYDAE_08915 [Steroidobacteraceae bacterium]